MNNNNLKTQEMNLPDVIQDLVKAQNSADSAAFANCFSNSSKVFDEGKSYTGKVEIKNWIEAATKEYEAVMKPIDFKGNNEKGVLQAEVSGNFPGSPIVLSYNFEFEGELIDYLKIT